MSDIKTKKKQELSIKKFDRAMSMNKNLKENLVNIKDKMNYSSDENTPTNYAGDKIIEKSNIIFSKEINGFNSYGKKAFNDSRENIRKVKKKLNKNNIKKLTKNIKQKFKKNNIKGVEDGTKKLIKTSQNAVIDSEKLEMVKVKNARKYAMRMKETAKAINKTIKKVIKATVKAIKSIIKAFNSLLTILTGGLWIFVMIIIIICIIALLLTSVFGIFFSSENLGDNNSQTKTMSLVVSELNKEFMNRITQIQKDNPYNEYDIISNRADWKEILAVYAVKVNCGNNTTELVTLDEDKINTLKTIFWEMNEISFSKDESTYKTYVLHWTYTETVEVTNVKLHISVSGKTAYEMADKYNFNEEQRRQLEELLKDDYSTAWASVIYGTSVGSNNIVNVAISQLGNAGGQPYWSWYGFSQWEQWCACFVSWCANECGYIDAGIIPKYALCNSEGVAWFKTCNLWKDRGFSPKPRRYYIF